MPSPPARAGDRLAQRTAARPALVFIPGAADLAPCLMAQTPVTCGQFAAVVGDPTGPYRRRPVTGVSWYAAVAYCNALSALEGLAPAYAGDALVPGAGGYRLPTVAEWAHAAAAGTTTAYWSGDAEADLARIGWYRANSGGRAHAVGSRPASPWGLYDVHGNVWVWCHDLVDGPTPTRAVRGGSYAHPALAARRSFRAAFAPTGESDSRGLRIVRAA